MFKPFPYLLKPAGTIVIIDSDMIVTRSLQPLLDLAGAGRICAFPDPEPSRWFGEWQQLFDLPCQPRHQTYVVSAFLAFSTVHWPDLLEHWWYACRRIWSHPTVVGGGKAPDGPSAQADQDALNALLMGELPDGALALQPADELVETQGLRQGVRVLGARTLACSYRGRPVTLLHSSGSPKPWDPRARFAVRHNAYVRLLPRLLYGSDVTLRIAPAQLPIWLRPGASGRLAMRGLDTANSPALRQRIKSLLPRQMVLWMKRSLHAAQ
jgi:hypothetical protein